MKLAFYSGTKGPIDELIRLRTNSDCAHVAFLFSDRQMFQASLGEETRFLFDKTDLPGWTSVELPPLDEQKLRDWCISQEGKKYSILSVIEFYLGRNTTDQGVRWDCSGLVTAGLQFVGLAKFLNPLQVSPYEIKIAALAWKEYHDASK